MRRPLPPRRIGWHVPERSEGRGDRKDHALRSSGRATQPLRKRSGGKMPPLRRRAGLLMVEMIVSLVLLGAVVSIVIPTLGWIGWQNRLSMQKQEAVQGLHNLMDELTARPYAELTPEAAGKIELPLALKQQLPSAKLQVEIAEAPPNARRIRLRLSWLQKNGRPLAPLRLSAWVYSREGRR